MLGTSVQAGERRQTWSGQTDTHADTTKHIASLLRYAIIKKVNLLF